MQAIWTSSSKTGATSLSGTWLTVQLVAISAVLGFALAVPLALARLSSNRLVSGAASAYSLFFRGTPLLVQFFLIYFGLGQFDLVRSSFLWPFLREAYVCALITLVLNTAAYSAEIVRGGIRAVPRGEVEAARACGMSTPHHLPPGDPAARLLDRAAGLLERGHHPAQGHGARLDDHPHGPDGAGAVHLLEHLPADPGLHHRGDDLLPADAGHHPDLLAARAALQPLHRRGPVEGAAAVSRRRPSR